jgi:large subunit ribosomal protein L25
MAATTLVAHTGRVTGSSASRRLRREGKIPGVLYGQSMAPIALAVERRELRLALSGPAGHNTVLELEVDGKIYPAIVKEIQRHPVRRTVNHVDFLQVNLNEEITVSVPFRIEGEAKAVISEGGLVDPAVSEIEVTTTPGLIPDELVVDVSDMHMGDVIRLADIELPPGVTATGDPESPVVTVLVLRGAAPEGGEQTEGEDTTKGAGEDESAAGEAEASDDAGE